MKQGCSAGGQSGVEPLAVWMGGSDLSHEAAYSTDSVLEEIFI